MDMKNLKASDVYKTLSGAQKVALYNQIQLEKNGPYAYSSEVEFEPAKGASLTTTHGMIEARMLQGGDRKSTRLNSSHRCTSRMPSSA